MQDKFLIEGGKELEGEIRVNGAKNAAGPILVATLLTDDQCIIDNIPHISDILNLLEILKDLGKKVEWLGERKVKISDGKMDFSQMDFEKISRSRVSVLLIGALLPRVKEFKFSRPGGDKIGVRPITTHLQTLKELGIKIEQKGDFYYFNSRTIKGKEITLPKFSVTATENLILVASLAQGTTVLKGVAQEPHVQDLIYMLTKMGARIEKIWGHKLKIHGVDKLKGTQHKIIPDSNEAGTFLAIGAACSKELLVKELNPDHLSLFLAKLKEMGINFEKGEDFIKIGKPQKYFPARIQALPYPGFPTDLLPLIVPLLTKAEGKSLIHDPLYEYRFNYIQEMKKMGADIEILDPHRALVFGKTPLSGVTIQSWDVRAGAALVLAALMAEGQSAINQAHQIDRGYEKLGERLKGIGANIRREN